MIKIIDESGNPLLIESIQAPLSKYEYVPEGEKKSIEATGNQLKIFVILFFLLQFIMRQFARTTMQYIWEVVHQMQFLYFLTLLPLPFSPVIDLFISFFEISTGNLDFITSLLPTIPEVVINTKDFPYEPVLYYEKFKESWADNPYLVANFGMIIL